MIAISGLAIGGAMFCGCASCDDEYVAGLGVLVRGGAKDGACDVTVRIRDGSYVEQLQCTASEPSVCNCGGAGERAGTYNVVVERNGAPLVQTSVEVEDGGCHVIYERVELEVAPSA